MANGRLLQLKLAGTVGARSPGLDLVTLNFQEYAADLEAICSQGRAVETLEHKAEGLASCARLLSRCAQNRTTERHYGSEYRNGTAYIESD